jgi:hypothetical protein
MPCPLCSSESVFETARRRRAEPAAQLTTEVLSMAQEVRDISSRLRHRSGADPEAADMLDDLARRMAHACRETRA